MTDETGKIVARRLKRARGHLSRVIKMVEKGDYCPDILIQSSAVQGALKKSDEIILDSHLHTCIVPKLGGKFHEKSLEEILEVFKRR